MFRAANGFDGWEVLWAAGFYQSSELNVLHLKHRWFSRRPSALLSAAGIIPTTVSEWAGHWWKGAAGEDVVLSDLTFNFQAVEDVYSNSVNLQLTGALLLHLTQDERAADMKDRERGGIERYPTCPPGNSIVLMTWNVFLLRGWLEGFFSLNAYIAFNSDLLNLTKTDVAETNYEKRIVSCNMGLSEIKKIKITFKLMQQRLCRWDSPGYGVLLPADKRAPQGAVVELGGAGALPGANARTTAESLPVWDCCCCFF